MEKNRAKHADLLASYTATCHAAHVTTVKVGSKGVISTASFEQVCSQLSHPRQEWRELQVEVVRKCILQSYDSWC